jgi:hypothetical protein
MHFLQHHFDSRSVHPDTPRFPDCSLFLSALLSEMIHLFPHTSYSSPLCRRGCSVGHPSGSPWLHIVKVVLNQICKVFGSVPTVEWLLLYCYIQIDVYVWTIRNSWSEEFPSVAVCIKVLKYLTAHYVSPVHTASWLHRLDEVMTTESVAFRKVGQLYCEKGFCSTVEL